MHLVSKSSHMRLVQGRVTISQDVVQKSGKSEKYSALGPALKPLVEGAWLGKPTPGNEKKKRFFQLSHDGSTLRWGWKKCVAIVK